MAAASRLARSPRASRPRKPAKAEWTRRTEARSLTPSRELWAQARENTKHAAQDRAFLVELAREIVLARAPELTRLYRNVVWAVPGFKKKGKRARPTGEPCVVLVVRRKDPKLPRKSAQHLPREFLTFGHWQGQQLPFAIPTDVQDAQAYYGAVAHSDSGVWLQKQGYAPDAGSFACLVRVQHDAGSSLCMLGAMHVFTPFPDGQSLQIEAGMPVQPTGPAGEDDTSPQLGTTLAWGGILRSDEQPKHPSLDVQLAQVEPEGEAEIRQRAALRKFNAAKPWVDSLADLLQLGTSFTLLVPDNNVNRLGRGEITVHLGVMPHEPFPLPYAFDANPHAVTHDVYHAELLRFDAADKKKVPLPGDSGSPIVFTHPDGTMTLVAMHIAGDELGASWAVPAWYCVKPQQWWEYPSGAQVAGENA